MSLSLVTITHPVDPNAEVPFVGGRCPLNAVVVETWKVRHIEVMGFGVEVHDEPHDPIAESDKRAAALAKALAKGAPTPAAPAPKAPEAGMSRWWWRSWNGAGPSGFGSAAPRCLPRARGRPRPRPPTPRPGSGASSRPCPRARSNDLIIFQVTIGGTAPADQRRPAIAPRIGEARPSWMSHGRRRGCG